MSAAGVLAVMDREIACEHVPGFIAEQLAEARASVATLMQANRELIERHDADAKLVNFSRCGCSVCIELRPALAACEGEV